MFMSSILVSLKTAYEGFYDEHYSKAERAESAVQRQHEGASPELLTLTPASDGIGLKVAVKNAFPVSFQTL